MPRQRPFWNQSSIYQLTLLLEGWKTQGGVMTTLQAICCGAMFAWTPSIIVLALLLREVPLDDEVDELQPDPS
jgi:hypothetical protein